MTFCAQFPRCSFVYFPVNGVGFEMTRFPGSTTLNRLLACLAILVATACTSADETTPDVHDAIDEQTTDFKGDESGLPDAFQECSDDNQCAGDDPCRIPYCDEQTNLCQVRQAEDEAQCDDGLPCTVNDRCHGGLCTGVERVCDDQNPCTTDSCNAANGSCQFGFNNDPCEDANLCTGNDSCSKGTCRGEPVDCDDDNPCTTDSCTIDEGCRHLVAGEAPCNDGNQCTVGDHCREGACVAGIASVCDDENPCTADQCQPATGECTFTPIPEALCDDNNACTQQDACQNGVCLGGSATPCDDNNPCTEDACLPATGCVHVSVYKGCDDGIACTVGDTCQDGVCTGGPAISCSDGNPCTADQCTPETGECEHTPVNWSCDDGNLCSTGDTCQGGFCIGTLVDCDDNNPCTVDACQANVGCVHTPVALGCDDSNPCTIGDICFEGICTPGGGGLNCNDFNPCTQDFCLPETGECSHEAVSGACEDGNPCTEGDFCSGGICQGGTLDTCECLSDVDCLPFDDGNLCNGVLFCDDQGWPPRCRIHPDSIVTCDLIAPSCQVVACNPDSGGCEFNDAPELTPCDDGNNCTGPDRCVAGECAGEQEVSCDDDNPCTDDICSPEEGCVVSTNANPCDDGNLCSIGDVCVGGYCAGLPRNCDDGNPCTLDICDPADGQCRYENSPSSCNDFNLCTDSDHCEDGLCVGNPVDCADSNPCTQDGCDPQDGCIHEPSDGGCNDHNACTTGELCLNGLCIGDMTDCDDDNPCTDDWCEGEVGCLHAPNQASCNDENYCTYGDHCSQGDCVGYEVVCTDGNPCTDTACNPQVGCVLNNLDIPCDDQSACTTGDWCFDGVCFPGFPTICDDDNACTMDLCDPATGECSYTPVPVGCDDSNICTTDDYCLDGVCTGYLVLCDDFSPCTSDGCDSETGCFHSPLDNLGCSDGSLCTTGDVCVAGVCVPGPPLACQDENPCTEDGCDPWIGCTFEPLNDLSCDDELPNTVLDHCEDGVCTGFPDLDMDQIPESGFSTPCKNPTVTQCNDNCPDVPNPQQSDLDGDGIGDLCELCGNVQPVDGTTPPDMTLWETTVSGACPANNKGLRAAFDGEEPILEFYLNRVPQCPNGILLGTLLSSIDLKGNAATLELDLELDAAVCPSDYAENLHAELRMVDGSSDVLLDALSPFATSGTCLDGLEIPDGAGRHSWTLVVEPDEEWVRVYRDGTELETSPVDLSTLSSWQVAVVVGGADYVAAEGTHAHVRIFSWSITCAW